MKKLAQKVLMLVVLMIAATCGLSAQNVLNETFENGFEPNGWTQSPASATVPWTVGSSGIGDVTPYQGDNMAKLYSASRQDSVRLISKSLDVTGMLEPTLDFYIAAPKFNVASTGDSLRIYIETGTTWKLIHTSVTNSATWQKRSIKIKEHIPDITSFRVAFQWAYGNGKGVALDNIMVYGADACTAPVNLRTRNITGDAARLMWNTSSHATSNRIKVFTSPVEDASQIETATALIDATSQFPVYEATGLTPETNYYWYAKSSCSTVDISEWSSVGPFRTLCATRAIPSGVENFDSYAVDTIPACWSYIVNLDGEWEAETSSIQFAPKIVASQPSDTVGKSLLISAVALDRKYTLAYAISPRFNVTSMQTYQLKFKLKSPSVNHVLSVGSMTDAHLQASFKKIRDISVTAPNEWQEVTVYLNTAENSSQFFAFMADGTEGRENTFLIDDLEILELPACATPISIESSNPTLNSVDLSWYGNSANYEIKAYQALSNPVTDTPAASAQNVTSPHTLTGLQSSSSYYVYIKGNCNGEWSQPIAIRTKQMAAALPLIEDFESILPPWDLSNGTQINKWHVGTALNNGGNKSMYISNDGGVTNGYDISTSSYVYAKRLLSLSLGKEYSISFDWKAGGEMMRDYCNVYLVPVDKNPEGGNDYGLDVSGFIPTDWILLANTLSSKTEWQSLENDKVTVPTSGDYYLVFCWKNNDGGGNQPPIAIDNVKFLEPTCGRPKDLIVRNITDVSATISWTPSRKGTPTQYSVYTVAEGTLDYTTATPQVTTNTTITVTGLSQQQKYHVYVVAGCSGAEGNSDPAKIGFKSNQTPSTIPYNEDFEGEITSFYLENGDQTNKWVVGTADHNGAGSKSMYISKNESAREYDRNKISFVYSYATFDLSNAETYNFKFDWKAYGKNKADILNVFLVPDDDRTVVAGNGNGMQTVPVYLPTGWIKIIDEESLFSTTTDWQTITKKFTLTTSGRYKLAFFWQNISTDGNESGAGAIDNVSLSLMDCPSPNNLTAETTESSLNITWPASSTAVSWNIAVVPTNTAATAFTNVTTPSYSFNQATPNTVYDVYVYAMCRDGQVSDTAKYQVKTTAIIPFTADFEDPNKDSNWALYAEAIGANRWTIGNGTNNGGNRAMYVSKDNSSYEYSETSGSVGYACVLFEMDQNAEYSVKYDWKGMGEAGYDFLKVFFIPESQTNIQNGHSNYIEGNRNTMPVGWVALSSTQLSMSNSWKTVDTLVSVPSSGKYYLSFFWRNDGGGGEQPPAAIDNVKVAKYICKKLTNVTVSNITTTDVVISWDAGTESASYDVKVSTSPIDPELADGDVHKSLGITETNIDLSGVLSAGTLYYAYVRSNCNNGGGSPYTMVKFSTACEPKNIPYSENFDSYDREPKTMPICWSTYVYKNEPDAIAGDFTPFVDAQTIDGQGVKFLNMPVFYKSPDGFFSSSFAIMPQFVEPINSIMISFKAKAKTASGKIAIGTVTDMNEPHVSFNRLREYDLTTELQNFLVPLDGFSGPANARIVFVVEGDRLLNSDNIFIDDVKVEALSNCNPPTGINHTFVRNDSVILKWNSIYVAAKTYQVIVSTEDVGTDYSRLNSLTPAQTAFNQNVTGDSVVVTGLAVNTKYYYYIRMVCDAGTYSSWFDVKKTFTTECRESDKCKLIVKTKDANGYGWGNNAKISIKNSEGVVLKEYKVPKTGTNGLLSDSIGLDTLTLCPGDYSVVYTKSSDANDVNSFELSLGNTLFFGSARLDDSKIVVKFSILNGCTSFVCDNPDTFNTKLQATTADITWGGTSGNYDVKVYLNSSTIDPDSSEPTPILSLENTTTTSANLTNLTPETAYVVFIRSICDNAGNPKTSTWSKYTFRTLLDMPLETLPFATGFEDDAENAKWKFSHSGSSNNWIVSNSVAKDGTKSLHISSLGAATPSYTYTTSSAHSSYAIRKFAMTASTNVLVSFDWKCEGEQSVDLARAFFVPTSNADISNGNLKGMSGSINDVPTGWIEASPLLQFASYSWSRSVREVSFPEDGEYFFVFFWKNDASRGAQPPAAIDNLSIIAACAAPKDLALSNVATSTADLAWVGNSDKYTVRVYQTDRDTINPNVHAASAEITNITTTSATLTGLTHNATHYLFVRGMCGADSSLWAKIKLRTKIEMQSTALPFTSGFEDNADNAKWIFTQGMKNRWVISDNTNNGGQKAMYVTSSVAAPFVNQYDATSTAFLYAFRKLDLSADDMYKFSFDWKAKGPVISYSIYDLGRVFLVPESQAASIAEGGNNGMSQGNNDTPEGWIDIGGTSSTSNLLYGQTAWQSVRKDMISVPTTGSYLLTFFWKNDHYGEGQPPLAVDNISMTKLDCPGAIGLSLRIERGSIIANWNGNSDSYTIKLFNYVENLDIETATPAQQATVTTTNHSFGGLSTGGYVVAIQGKCGTSTSAWRTASIAFLETDALPIVTDFQNPVDNQKWKFSNNGTVNKWTIGGNAVETGNNALYVSEDGGASNSYNITAGTRAYAYRTVELDANKAYITKFNWTAKGEGNYDYLRAFIVPSSADLTDGKDNGVTSAVVPAGWIDITEPGGKLSMSNGWSVSEKVGLTVSSNGIYHIVFYWRNDVSKGEQPAATIDDFSFKEIEKVDVAANICLGSGYSGHHFDIPADSLPAAGVYKYSKTFNDPEGGYQVINLTLTVISSTMHTIDSTVCAGAELDFFGNKIIAATSGEYNHYTYSISTGCDSVVRLNLTVNPSYTINIDTVITSLPATVGNRTFPAGYPNGEYPEIVSGTTAFGCDSTTAYNVKIDVPVGLNGASVSGLTIAPNPIEVGQSVEIRSEFSPQELNGLKVEVLNTAGSVLSTVTPKNKPIRIDGFRVSGVYVIRLTTGTGNIVYGKVIVK